MDGLFVIMNMVMNLNGLEPSNDPKMEKDGDRWFKMYGDNRTLSVAELQQILDFL